MRYTKKICSFTGYRQQKLNYALKGSGHTIEELQEALDKEVEKVFDGGVRIYQCGMATGGDMMFARSVLGLRARYPGISLVAMIPCLGQESGWPEKDKIAYHEVLAKADEVKIISNRPYFTGCMQIRNRALVDNCDELIAIYDGRHGGTMQTLEYAKSRLKRIIVLDPHNLVKVSLFGPTSGGGNITLRTRLRPFTKNPARVRFERNKST